MTPLNEFRIFMEVQILVAGNCGKYRLLNSTCAWL